MPQQLTIGIACDNYKVSRYKKELKDLNIEIKSEVPFNSEVMLLSVLSDKDTISKLTRKVEKHFFIQRNN